MIEARDLGFRFAPDAPWLFRDLSFSLTKGQTLALLGRNGRGKTTLLKCVANLLSPSAGKIESGGMIGYVPQQFSTPFSYSVYDVVLMGRARHLGMFSNPTKQDHARAHEALELVGLTDFADRAIMTLSGGERQLALIARALASEADIMLLDEPTSALDFRNQAIVLSMLRHLAAERGLIIIMTTHDPTHALEIADRAIFLYGPERAEEGPIETMFIEEKLSDLYGITMRKFATSDDAGRHANIVADYGSIGGVGA